MSGWIRLVATLQVFVACSDVNAMDADNAAAIKQGMRLFNTHCVICHGVGGQGGDKAPSLVPRLTNTDDVALVAYLKTGDPAKGMPPAPVEAAQLPALIGYLRAVTGTSGNAAGARPNIGRANPGPDYRLFGAPASLSPAAISAGLIEPGFRPSFTKRRPSAQNQAFAGVGTP